MTTYDETTINFNSAEATSPSDINILGEIVGLYAVGYTDYGFTYTNGNFATIGELGYGINNSGTIVGGPTQPRLGPLTTQVLTTLAQRLDTPFSHKR